MYERLKALFDKSTWSNKHFEKLPDNETDIRYAWREDEVEFAELFLKSGKVLTESTAAVDRGLYLGKDQHGYWKLCVTERTRSDYDPKEVARGISSLMDASRFLQKMEKATTGQTGHTS
ncbi:MAG TPA: hypothetical protein ENN39_08665 [Desulfonatronum sp.]|nr:hypothetical protein [Desulfonatronum sp.]